VEGKHGRHRDLHAPSISISRRSNMAKESKKLEDLFHDTLKRYLLRGEENLSTPE
jgi:hypothetical protein